MDGRPLANGLVRALLSLGDAALRASYVLDMARRWDADALAAALDIICQRAEQAEAASREALVAIVDALNTPGLEHVVQLMREHAVGDSLFALERLIRSPIAPARATRRPWKGRCVDGPDGSRGRSLTLGERKSLARRPNRETMTRLLSDPHPDVISGVLRNAVITEDDVVRFAAKRPGRGEILAEIVRSTRWAHRPRVRMALVMNPATPIEIASRLVGLLLRPELDLVAGSPGVSPSVRALCLEHLARRPPFPRATRPSDGIH